jgi:hypothetical protein
MATQRAASGIRSWVEHNTLLARQVLTPPPPPPNLYACGSTGIFLDTSVIKAGSIINTLEMYLQHRNWKIPDHNASDKEAAIGLVSYPLTYPLTLGYFMTNIITKTNLSCSITAQYGTTTNPIRICCIGARAEATLPEPFWKELLISTFPLSWDITFIGPEVIPSKKKNIQDKLVNNTDDLTLLSSVNNSDQFLRLSFHHGYFHDYITTIKKQNNSKTKTTTTANNNSSHDLPSSTNVIISETWDGAVLFNPGIGHPHLQKKWEGTMKLLIQSNIPLLLTAHNQVDCDRDLQALKEIIIPTASRPSFSLFNNDDDDDDDDTDAHLGYRTNPWSSRMDVTDPLDPTAAQLVRTNSHVLVLSDRYSS